MRTVKAVNLSILSEVKGCTAIGNTYMAGLTKRPLCIQELVSVVLVAMMGLTWSMPQPAPVQELELLATSDTDKTLTYVRRAITLI